MGQYRTRVFVCPSGDTCPSQGDVEEFVYAGVRESHLQEIFDSHVRGGKPVPRLVHDPGVKDPNKKPGCS